MYDSLWIHAAVYITTREQLFPRHRLSSNPILRNERTLERILPWVRFAKAKTMAGSEHNRGRLCAGVHAGQVGFRGILARQKLRRKAELGVESLAQWLDQHLRTHLCRAVVLVGRRPKDHIAAVRNRIRRFIRDELFHIRSIILRLIKG